ncbi:hypothetical protein SLA2020_283270 [Shorea laevis]
MDSLTSQTQTMNWKDNPPLLRPYSPDSDDISNLTLIGKLISLKLVPKSHVGLALQRAWRFLKSLSIADMGPNLFLFKFESAPDMGKVLDYTPWNVSGHPLFFKSCDPEAALEEIDFNLGAYWVQIFGFLWII